MINNITENPAVLMLEWIKSFNRKERYHVIRTAITGESQPLPLDQDFRSKLSSILNHPEGTERKINIPEAPYVAIDYHLDWLSAALHLSQKGVSVESLQNMLNNKYDLGSEKQKILQGTQEDIDLLITYIDETTQKLVLILIEAKAGSAWSAEQLKSKGERLSWIFPRDSQRFIDCHFVLLGPTRKSMNRIPGAKNSQGIGLACLKWNPEIKNHPEWFCIAEGKQSLFRYMEMSPDRGLFYPTRLHKNGEPEESDTASSKTREYKAWTVKPVISFRPQDKSPSDSKN